MSISNYVSCELMCISSFIAPTIKAYEKKYQIFSSLGFSHKEAFEKINLFLTGELNIDIEKLYENDYHSFLMIISAFYGEREALGIPKERDPLGIAEEEIDVEKLETTDFLADCDHPLHTLMVMCFATSQMKKLLLRDNFGENFLTEKYDRLSSELEDLACKLINHLDTKSYRVSSGTGEQLTGPVLSKLALQIDFQHNASKTNDNGPAKYLDRKFVRSMEIMAIAYKAKAKEFLFQKPCLNLMRTRYICPKTSNDCEGRQQNTMKTEKSIWLRLRSKFQPTLRKKLIFHLFFRVVYIMMFTYMLCCSPYYDDYGSMKPISFFYVLSVLITQFFMTVIKLNDYRKFHMKELSLGCSNSKIYISSCFKLANQYFHSNVLSLWRMAMIFFVAFFEVFRFVAFCLERTVPDSNFWYGMWTIVPIFLEILYCALFSIVVISSLRFFHYISSLRFFVHLLSKMYKTVLMFFSIFCTFWYVLAVIHVSISRTFAHSTNTILYTLVAEGKFEIFGEVKDEDRNGNLVNCSHFTRNFLDFFDMHYAEASCLIRSTLMPFLVFGYMFIAGILLVNLLTAQLTKEYEKESESSRYYKGYLKYEQLSKIESKLLLPPPFSLVYVLFRLFFFWSNWMLVNMAEKVEGSPWGSVRNVSSEEQVKQVEKEIKTFLTKGPEHVYQDLKEIVSQYIRGGVKVNANDLGKIRKKLNELLDTAIRDDDRATGARSRAATRAELRADDDDPAEEGSLPITLS